MGKLLLLFVVGFIGLALRYLFLGKFEMDQLLLLMVFPVAAILILFVMKWQHKKDLAFQPEADEERMVTRLGDRVSAAPKRVFDGQELVGEYKRFYHKPWKRVVADIMDSPGRWFLNLAFSSEDGHHIVLKGKNENSIRGTNEWLIFSNNDEVGSIQMDYSVKNVAKLKESLYLNYYDHTYHYQSFGIGSKTVIRRDNHKIAEGKRAEVGNSIYELDMVDTYKAEADVLFMGFVLFNYHFSQ
ncbi:tubby C-terminal domain-like protein [Pseudalkalibacillus sp. NRS-1564]|uniref:tubby C-terminal domain-like protein n=1 Tax=Pseudalkalibacillus sp. NRS-1564 TaxID=3233900 RepID=UPI003D2DFA43